MNRVILDHVERLEFDADAFPVKNLHALWYLPVGLRLIADSIRHKESEVAATHGPDLALSTLSGELAAVVTSWFGWFSISLVSYARLVRLVSLMAERGWDTGDLKVPANREAVKDACTSYVKSVVPAVYYWRNKIGAHPAITDPFRDDNLGTLELSIMVPVVFQYPRFHAGVLQWGTQGEQSTAPQWSVTEVYEALSPRFWPSHA